MRRDQAAFWNSICESEVRRPLIRFPSTKRDAVGQERDIRARRGAVDTDEFAAGIWVADNPHRSQIGSAGWSRGNRHQLVPRWNVALFRTETLYREEQVVTVQARAHE